MTEISGQSRSAGPPSKVTRPRRRHFVKSPAFIVGVLLLTALAWGVVGHVLRDREAADTQRSTEKFVPLVMVAPVKIDDGPIMLTLPGNTEAFDSATLYARSTGYIAERLVDIGSRVHAGDLLARIAAPDLDQQLAAATGTLAQTVAQMDQAKADVQQNRSGVNLAKVTSGRSTILAGNGYATQEQADTDRLGLAGKRASLASALAGVTAGEAGYKAQLATVQRLQQLTAYEKVIAPFDGIITARNIDIGDLVTSDSNGAAGNVLFIIAHDDVLRVQVDVPQSAAVGIHDGLSATVHVPEMPDRTFTGKIARSTVALNPSSRSLHIEVDVENPDGALSPGLYVQVDLAVPRVEQAFVVPAEAIIFNGKGLRVATVAQDGTVHLRNVSIYRDLGTTVELRDGVRGGDRVVTNPPAGLQDGTPVRVAPPEQVAKKT